MDSAPALSLVIPVYDEAQRIGATLETIAAGLGERDRTEVLIADDGSRDGTGEIATELGQRLGLQLRVLREETNRGKGYAIRRGMLAAEGDVVLFSDADLSVSIDHVERFVRRIDAGADVVVGTRLAPGAQIAVHQPWLREFLGGWFRRMVSVLLVPDISDFTCGFKAFRRDAARAIFARQRITGWAFDAEILFVAQRLGLVMVEEPVVWRDDRRTRVRLFRDVGRSAWELAQIRWNAVRGVYDVEGADAR